MKGAFVQTVILPWHAKFGGHGTLTFSLHIVTGLGRQPVSDREVGLLETASANTQYEQIFGCE